MPNGTRFAGGEFVWIEKVYCVDSIRAKAQSEEGACVMVRMG